jgi:hypothetical protein
MFRSPAPFDSPYEKHDPGPGVGAGFGIGVLIYVVSWFLVTVVEINAFPIATIATYTSANLIAHLLLNGDLIWGSLATYRRSCAQGLIICGALGFLLDSACWGVARYISALRRLLRPLR